MRILFVADFAAVAWIADESTVADEILLGHLTPMSTLSEIENAVERLPARQKEKLLAFLTKKLGQGATAPTRRRRGLKAAGRPALEGLPADLSIGTRERARALIAERYAASH